MAVTYLSREETRRFALRLRSEMSRRQWRVSVGCEKLGIPQASFSSWITTADWGRRIRHADALRIGVPLGIPIPRPRVVTSYYEQADGDFEEWLDHQFAQLNSGQSAQRSDVGIITAIFGTLLSRWANLGLEVTLFVDAGRGREHPRAELNVLNVHEFMTYVLVMDFQGGTVIPVLERRPRQRVKAGADRAVAAVFSPHGNNITYLERRLARMNRAHCERFSKKGKAPLKMLEDFERALRNYAQNKQNNVRRRR